jgi:hypothetical protein
MTLIQTIRSIFGAIINLVHLGWLNLWSEPMAAKFFDTLQPYLAGLGGPLIVIDDNDTGTDDIVGHLLLFSADVIGAVRANEDLPPFPDVITGTVGGKINGATRTAIILASAALGVAEIQLSLTNPKASKALKYVNQVLRAISAGKPVPAAPAF